MRYAEAMRAWGEQSPAPAYAHDSNTVTVPTDGSVMRMLRS